MAYPMLSEPVTPAFAAVRAVDPTERTISDLTQIAKTRSISTNEIHKGMEKDWKTIPVSVIVQSLG
jgi:hypothetical protein